MLAPQRQPVMMLMNPQPPVSGRMVSRQGEHSRAVVHLRADGPQDPADNRGCLRCLALNLDNTGFDPGQLLTQLLH